MTVVHSSIARDGRGAGWWKRGAHTWKVQHRRNKAGQLAGRMRRNPSVRRRVRRGEQKEVCIDVWRSAYSKSKKWLAFPRFGERASEV